MRARSAAASATLRIVHAIFLVSGALGQSLSQPLAGVASCAAADDDRSALLAVSGPCMCRLRTRALSAVRSPGAPPEQAAHSHSQPPPQLRPDTVAARECDVGDTRVVSSAAAARRCEAWRVAAAREQALGAEQTELCLSPGTRLPDGLDTAWTVTENISVHFEAFGSSTGAVSVRGTSPPQPQQVQPPHAALRFRLCPESQGTSAHRVRDRQLRERRQRGCGELRAACHWRPPRAALQPHASGRVFSRSTPQHG
jgi:hypothetical protein